MFNLAPAMADVRRSFKISSKTFNQVQETVPRGQVQTRERHPTKNTFSVLKMRIFNTGWQVTHHGQRAVELMNVCMTSKSMLCPMTSFPWKKSRLGKTPWCKILSGLFIEELKKTENAKYLEMYGLVPWGFCTKLTFWH